MMVLWFRKRIGGDSFGGFDEAGPKDGAQRIQHILHLVSSTGEHEKLTQVTRALHAALFGLHLNIKIILE